MITVIAVLVIWTAFGWVLWRCYREAMKEWHRLEQPELINQARGEGQ